MRTLLAALIAAFFVTACASIAPRYEIMREMTVAFEDDGLVRGAGVIVDREYVVTNSHVIAGTDTILFYSGDRSGFEVLFDDPEMDIAILKLPVGRPVSARVDCSPMAVGEVIYAIGHPAGVQWGLTSGQVVQNIPDEDGQITVDGMTASGSSGGPYFSADGRLRGVVVAFRLQAVAFYPMPEYIRIFAIMIPASAFCGALKEAA